LVANLAYAVILYILLLLLSTNIRLETDKVKLLVKEWDAIAFDQAIAILDSPDRLDDGALITSDQNFLRLFPRKQPGAVSLGVVKLQAGSEPKTVIASLNAYLPKDVRAFTYQEYVDAELNYIQNSTAIGFIFVLGRAIGFIVGIVIVYQILSTDVNDHMAEYATFKAMGYRNSYLLGVVFEEAIILAVIGFVPSVAIARALVAHPAIVLADEPTAALDSKSRRDVVNLMQRLAKEQGSTILLVTHDNRILDVADRIVHLEDGKLINNSIVAKSAYV
jgi:hypothetical protein